MRDRSRGQGRRDGAETEPVNAHRTVSGLWSGVVRDLIRCLNGRPPPNPDWMEVLKTANDHLVAPALYLAMADADALKTIPLDVCAYLEDLFKANTARNLRMKSQLQEAALALNAIRVEPMAIKGAGVLLTQSETSIGRRMMVDLDLIVPSRSQQEVICALENIGYIVSTLDVGDHAFANLIRPRDAGSIDLHHRLPGPKDGLGDGDPLGPRITMQMSGARLHLASPTERVAHLVVHDMLHDQHLLNGTFTLRHLLDAREIILTNAIDWPKLRRVFSKGSRALALEVYLLNLRSFFGLPLPSCLKPSLLSVLLHLRQRLKAQSAAYRALDHRLSPTGHKLWLGLSGHRPVGAIGS